MNWCITNTIIRCRQLVESKIKQVFAVGYVDELSGIKFPGFECETNLFRQAMKLYKHCVDVMREVFCDFTVLLEIITSFEDNPNDRGGIFELFESLKASLWVFKLFS